MPLSLPVATAALAALAALLLPPRAAAQLIPVKSVPVASGDQFLVLPAQRLGMAGVTVAVHDTLHDPFVNPGAGARLAGGWIFGAPTFYGISDDNGDAQTLPIGALGGGRRWFGAASLAIQQLEGAERFRGACCWEIARGEAPRPLDEASARNLYLAGSAGRTFGRTSAGVGLSYAGLGAVDGVELLYAGSETIEQQGHQVDYRLGIVHDLGRDRTLELVLLHNRFRMTHDVSYLDLVWTPGRLRPEVRRRTETNRDETNTWGAHLGYVGPRTSRGWRLGGVLTANLKDHPKIPNYEIMNIPRDPGHSWAYQVGVGAARETGPATVAIDVILEPIWSETWAEADTAIARRGGGRIEPGEKTVENDFFFTNALLRMALGRETERYGVQLGLQVRSIDYDLEQWDNVAGTKREQDEAWMEWTPTWGAALRFPELQIRYAGRLTTGTGRPGVAWSGGWGRAIAESFASDFIVAPSGALTLQDAVVLTHQVAVVIPVH